MPHGYSGKILRVDLSQGKTWVEKNDTNWYRRYLGGVGFISYYLLKEVPRGCDAFDPENRLIFAPGPVNGVPIPAAGRNAVGAKSPLSGGWGKTEVGGWFGAELKRAGWDAMVVQGKADNPVYIWLDDDRVEIRDASHLWGKSTKETLATIREDLGDRRIRATLIGPGGEKLVRFACIINDLRHTGGRTGMGAVMGSKNLKAIAVRGTVGVEIADAAKIREMSRWMGRNYLEMTRDLSEFGTAGRGSNMEAGSLSGNLPTRNFRDGYFATAGLLDARRIRFDMEGCYACPIRCKMMVRTGAPYFVDPIYGGPEYETLAALGSNCGIDDVEAVSKAHELCNAYSIDTISAGATIAFAMECFENGLLTLEDTGGIELGFGNAQAMVQVMEQIGRREGIGDLLAEGTLRAAQEIGKGAEEYAMEVKGVDLGMHEPRGKQVLGLGYAVCAHGADHGAGLHDTMLVSEGPGLDAVRELTINKSMPIDYLGPEKVRAFRLLRSWRNVCDSLVTCNFVPWTRQQLMEIARGVTGWSFNMFEAMVLGERIEAMARAFNMREGLTASDDRLPNRYFEPPTEGHLREHNIAIDREAFQKAVHNYYGMFGWDRDTGVPLQDTLDDLDISWVGEELS